MIPREMQNESEYPRALMRYIKCRILVHGDFNFIPQTRHDLENAIEISHQRFAAGMHLPWAWYDIGFFEMLPDLNIFSCKNIELEL